MVSWGLFLVVSMDAWLILSINTTIRPTLPRAIGRIMVPPPDVNHWVIDPKFIERLVEGVGVRWCVNFHPFVLEPNVRRFSLFLPFAAFGQRTNLSFSAGNLSGVTLVAPQGFTPDGGMAKVVPSCQAAFSDQISGGSVIAIVHHRRPVLWA